MALNKPYRRIVRPGVYAPAYVTDPRYAEDRLSLARSFMSMERELREVFDFVETADSNLKVFSIKLYTLLLRACTDVEQNLKTIMMANGYMSERNMNMTDYAKVERAAKLSEYTVRIKYWRSRKGGELKHGVLGLRPFASFGGTDPRSPGWYRDYNEVKHNREENFELANLENVLNALGAVLILLYVQFGSKCLSAYSTGTVRISRPDRDDDIFDPDIIFKLVPPERSSWKPEELYDFDWSELRKEDKPFAKFEF